MPANRPSSPLLSAFLAVCVFVLGLAGVSPRLHQQLCAHLPASGLAALEEHHEDHSHASHHHEDPPATASSDAPHVCAVTLFAAGCDLPLAPFVSAPPSLLAESSAGDQAWLLVKTLRGPQRACGPPALV